MQRRPPRGSLVIVHVEPAIEDFLAGRDPVIDKAVEVLQATLAEQE